MKVLNLLLWVTQFGLSILFPPCFFLLLANWLQNKYGWGHWILIAGGILGVLIAISTARANLKAMLNAAAELSEEKDPPSTAFNDHH